MRRDEFRISDSDIGAWTTIENDWESYRAVRSVLKENGYVLHRDPQLQDRHKCIRDTHHAGSKHDVHFRSEIYPAGFRFEFYEDVVRDNPNGGRYTFDKMEKMPYLRRLRVKLILSKIADRLVSRGFVDNTERPPSGAFEYVRWDRAQWSVHHESFYQRPIERYNSEDADGQELRDGMVRYGRTLNGRLVRGTVFYRSNNMWHLVLNRHEVTQYASFQLFSYRPGVTDRKIAIEPKMKLSRALACAIKRCDFRRAASIQDVIRRTVGQHEFKRGDEVSVDHPNYVGSGVVQYVRPPISVGVKLSNGNTWEYEWATVRPAERSLA